MTRGIRVHVLVTLAAALLVAGCGGDGDNGEASCPPPGFATERKELSAYGFDLNYLTDVAVEPTRCGDRVVFEFRDGASGVRVQYLPRKQALVEDGSGNRVEAEGEAFLVVRLEPAATAESDGDQLEFTYTGPRRLRPGRRALRSRGRQDRRLRGRGDLGHRTGRGATVPCRSAPADASP